MVLVNALANLVICLSTIAVIIFVYGRSSMIEKLPKWETYLVKIGLSFMASGSLFNFLSLSCPDYTEVMLNAGLAAVFLWVALFHYKYFVK